MMIHDIIKIKYVRLGYIRKNYPYHLISDEEMFNAFIEVDSDYESSLIDPETRFFDSYYPNPFDVNDVYQKKNADGDVVEEINLYKAYESLKEYIRKAIENYLKYYGTSLAEYYQIPEWVYTYMLGEVVYQKSDYLDIQDTLALLGCSNLDNEFTKEACVACFATSLGYVSSLTTGSRPASVFGEPHVIKCLRLEA